MLRLNIFFSSHDNNNIINNKMLKIKEGNENQQKIYYSYVRSLKLLNLILSRKNPDKEKIEVKIQYLHS